jgi:hypothetical protein
MESILVDLYSSLAVAIAILAGSGTIATVWEVVVNKKREDGDFLAMFMFLSLFLIAGGFLSLRYLIESAP